MGRRIWVAVPERRRDGKLMVTAHTYDCRVLSFRQWLPANDVRTKHMVQLWCDPGGMRTLSVGSIHLKDPGRIQGGKKAMATQQANGTR